MTTKKEGLKRRRDRATHCYYCHCQMTHNIPPTLGTDATIEHLNSRNEFPEGRPNVGNTIVIACQGCNAARAEAEIKGLGVERLRELARRWPGEFADPRHSIGA